MSYETLLDRLDSTINTNLASLIPSDPDGLLTRLRRIETILRNSLPTDDKDEANTITHAHTEVERALEDIDSNWWVR